MARLPMKLPKVPVLKTLWKARVLKKVRAPKTRKARLLKKNRA